MTEQEIKTLKEFEENDKELEDIALHVAEQLDSLKDKAIKTGSEIQGQNELLTKGNRLSFYWVANESAEDTQLNLTKQNNELSKLLNKYRNGKQIWLDFILLSVLLSLLALLWNRLKARNFV
jgi:hypothetical protein